MPARARREPFGFSVALDRPQMLVLLGRGDVSAEALDPAAPFEAHLTVDQRCRQNCPGCYIDARPERPPGMEFHQWRQVLERLRALGVFHLALGAGEDADLGMLIGLAQQARRLGLTPNLSTAGSQITPSLARRLEVFHRVHLNLDRTDGPRWLALKILRAFHPRVGVNLVLTRENLAALPEFMRRLSHLQVRSAELLRFKPAGRGVENYAALAPPPEGLDDLAPRVLKLGLRYFINIRLDCSLTPFICQGGWSPALLASLGIAGCVGGSWFLSIDAWGRVCGCSFAHQPADPSWHSLGEADLAGPFSGWRRNPPAACAGCRYLSLCRGGCRVVARHLSGDFSAPDPHCPRVRNNRAQAS